MSPIVAHRMSAQPSPMQTQSDFLREVERLVKEELRLHVFYYENGCISQEDLDGMFGNLIDGVFDRGDDYSIANWDEAKRLLETIKEDKLEAGILWSESVVIFAMNKTSKHCCKCSDELKEKYQLRCNHFACIYCAHGSPDECLWCKYQGQTEVSESKGHKCQ